MATRGPTLIAGKPVGPVGYGLLGESHSTVPTLWKKRSDTLRPRPDDPMGKS